jgi:hypothetical protein
MIVLMLARVISRTKPEQKQKNPNKTRTKPEQKRKTRTKPEQNQNKNEQPEQNPNKIRTKLGRVRTKPPPDEKVNVILGPGRGMFSQEAMPSQNPGLQGRS